MKKITLLTASVLALGVLGATVSETTASAEETSHHHGFLKSFSPISSILNANVDTSEVTSLDLINRDVWSTVAPLEYQYITADNLGADGYPTTDTNTFRMLVNDNLDLNNISMVSSNGFEAVGVPATDDGASDIPGLRYVKFDTEAIPFSDGFPIYFEISETPGGTGKTFAKTTVNPSSKLDLVTLDSTNLEVWSTIVSYENQAIYANGLNSDGYPTTDTNTIRLLVNDTINADNLSILVPKGHESYAVTGIDDGDYVFPGVKYVKFDISSLPIAPSDEIYFQISEHPGGEGKTFANTSIK